MSSNFAPEGMVADEALLARTIDWFPRGLASCDQISTLSANNPETISLTVTTLVRLSPSTIPRVHVLQVSVHLCFRRSRRYVFHAPKITEIADVQQFFKKKGSAQNALTVLTIEWISQRRGRSGNVKNRINTSANEPILMRLEPLYTIRFSYPEDLGINLVGKKGTEEDHFLFAEGTCEGRVSGKFRGSNHPRRRTDETFIMNIQGYIEIRDSSLIMLDYQGYGRSTDRSQELYKAYSAANEKTKNRRQVVGFARHVADSEKYRWLNDAVCAISGEVRAPVGIPREQVKQPDVKLVFDVAELVWESPLE